MRKSMLPLFIFAASLFCAPVGGFADSQELKIVTSFYPMYIMARNVARDVPGVTVENLTPAVTGCLHDYALTNEDMRKLADAMVFVANGAGMESFLDAAISQYPRLKVIRLSEGIPLIRGAEGDNPHVWVSISDAIIQVGNLGRALGEADPAHKELYARNTMAYVAKLEALCRRMHGELAPYQGREIITFHEAFPYFAREFGFTIAAVIEREPGSEPSAKELAETIELIRKSHIAVLFSEPQYPSVAAQTIARETGAKVYMLDPAVTGPDEYDAYIETMERNLRTLIEAFRESPGGGAGA